MTCSERMSTELTPLPYQHTGQRSEPDENRCQKVGEKEKLRKELWNESCGNVTLCKQRNKANKHVQMDKFGERANKVAILWKVTAATPQASFRGKYKWVGIFKMHYTCKSN